MCYLWRTMRPVLVISVVWALLWWGATVPAAHAEEGESSVCVSLLLTHCDQCHYVTRVCQKLGKKSKWKWKRTMKNMVRHGAKITRTEQKTLIDCLAKKEASVVAYCENPLPADQPRIEQNGPAAARQK